MKGGSADGAALASELARACASAEPLARTPILPRERALAKLQEGLPLLHGESLQIELAPARALALLLADVAQAHSPSSGAASVVDALSRGRLDLEQLVLEAVARHVDHLESLAQSAAVSCPALLLLAEPLACTALNQLRSRMSPLLPDRGEWDRPYCPLCGDSAQADSERDPAESHARCKRCGAEWAFKSGGPGRRARISTPFRLELGEPDLDGALVELLEAD